MQYLLTDESAIAVKTIKEFIEAFEAGHTADSIFITDSKAQLRKIFALAQKRKTRTTEILYAACLQYGVGCERNTDEAIAVLKPLAKDDINAKMLLGTILSTQTQDEKAVGEALKMVTEASDAGHPMAQFIIAYTYLSVNTEEKVRQGIELLRKSIDAGVYSAMHEYARILHYGIKGVVERDDAKSFELMKKAADAGFVPAIHNLGGAYENGIGTAPDIKKAVECYERAIEYENADSMAALGLCALTGSGVIKNPPRAVRLFERAAQEGNAYGQYNLGIAYRDGEFIAQDIPKAIELFQKAANQGHTTAMITLGGYYMEGKHLPKDSERAAQLFLAAARAGDPMGIRCVGNCLLEGNGIDKDEALAVKYFERGDALGDSASTYNLAFCYKNGLGVEKDDQKALEILQRAAESGFPPAVETMQNLLAAVEKAKAEQSKQ